jgi:hypothetical protein
MHVAAPTILPVPMKSWRVWLVLCLAGAITAGHLYDVISQTEQWPFSYYPMYARAEKRQSLTVLSLYAVIKRDGHRRVVRVTDAPDLPQLPALNEGRLRVILMAAWNRPPGNNEAAARDVLGDYIRLYEAHRLAGLLDGPQILEARLYKLTWRLGPDGSRKSRPNRAQLLASVAARDVLY